MCVGRVFPRGLVREVPALVEREGRGDGAVDADADFVGFVLRVRVFVCVRLVKAVVAVDPCGKSGDFIGRAGPDLTACECRQL